MQKGRVANSAKCLFPSIIGKKGVRKTWDINLLNYSSLKKYVIGRLREDFEWRKPWDTFDKIRGQQ